MGLGVASTLESKKSYRALDNSDTAGIAETPSAYSQGFIASIEPKDAQSSASSLANDNKENITVGGREFDVARSEKQSISSAVSAQENRRISGIPIPVMNEGNSAVEIAQDQEEAYGRTQASRSLLLLQDDNDEAPTRGALDKAAAKPDWEVTKTEIYGSEKERIIAKEVSVQPFGEMKSDDETDLLPMRLSGSISSSTERHLNDTVQHQNFRPSLNDAYDRDSAEDSPSLRDGQSVRSHVVENRIKDEKSRNMRPYRPEKKAYIEGKRDGRKGERFSVSHANGEGKNEQVRSQESPTVRIGRIEIIVEAPKQIEASNVAAGQGDVLGRHYCGSL
jgi:hypothetical protein